MKWGDKSEQKLPYLVNVTGLSKTCRAHAKFPSRIQHVTGHRKLLYSSFFFILSHKWDCDIGLSSTTQKRLELGKIQATKADF